MKSTTDQLQRKKIIIEFQLFNLIDELGLSVKKDSERKFFIYALFYVQLMQQHCATTSIGCELEFATNYEKIKISYYIDYLNAYLNTPYSEDRERIICIVSTTFIDSINPESDTCNLNDFVTIFVFKKLFQKIFNINQNNKG